MHTGHPPFDWAIQAIERKADEAIRRLHEIDALRSDVGRLERTIREIRTEIDGLRNEFQRLQDRVSQDLNDRGQTL